MVERTAVVKPEKPKPAERNIMGSGAPTLTFKTTEEDEHRDPPVRTPGQAGLPEYLVDD